MSRSPAREAIAFLIEAAQKGDIDPWDVRVIEIIDRFLSELGLIGDRAIADCFTDLPQSGQAFLWASMLVLLKADTLEKTETEIEEDSASTRECLEADPNAIERSLPKHLEQHLRPRGSARPPRKRRVTLPELIEQIEKIAKELEAKTSLSSRRRDRSYSRSQAAKAITQLAHNENLTEVAQQLEKFLALDLPNLSPQENCIDLEQLLEWWSRLGSSSPAANIDSPEQMSTTKDRVGVFWALLLLSAQSKVELSQAEFYQDLKIKPLQNDRSVYGVGSSE